jgi:type I restriction enzyme, S subunit
MIDINNIPKHWEVKKLGEVCFTTSGGTPNRKYKNYYNGKIPWVKSGELDKGLILDSEEKITYEAIKNSSAKVFPKGTLLIALYGATIGKLAFLGIDAATNQAICGIYQNENIESNYIFHFLALNKQYLIKQGVGGAQPNISQTILKNLDIPLPPLPEQQQIVTKIETLFAEIENGKQKLLAAKQELENYKQSLFQELLNIECNKSIEDVTTKIDQGWSPKCYNESSVSNNEWAVIKTTAIQSGYFDETQNKILPKELAVKDKYEINVDDLLITRAGPRIRVGICCLVKKTRPKLLLCDKVYRLRINNKIAMPEYIEAIINSPKYTKEIEAMKSGISDSGVNLTQIAFKKIRIPVPSLKIQKNLVQKLQDCFSICSELNKQIVNSLQQAETLKQSILQQAFEGKLVNTQAKVIEIYKPKNEYFYQCQILGAIIRASNNNNIQHGEMTLAKVAYLVDKVYQIPTYYQYKQWHLGPYAPAMKKAINKKDFFTTKGNSISLAAGNKLFNYDNPNIETTENAINELSQLILKYDAKDRPHKIELLATICKVVEDAKCTALSTVREVMQNWKIDLKNTTSKNKAEKFTEEETKRCLEFIVNRGWDKKLKK